MTQPAPRPNLDISPGIKLQPFADAKLKADAGCGGTANRDPGVQTPTIAYTPGASVTVEWKLTIPHPADAEDSGVRIALHYGAGDSFAQNILAGGVVGDPPYTIVSAGEGPTNGLITQTVTLPLGKTCDYCQLCAQTYPTNNILLPPPSPKTSMRKHRLTIRTRTSCPAPSQPMDLGGQC